MPKVQDIKILNVDNTEYLVDTLSDNCKHLVSVYNEWNQKEADARDQVAILQAAKEQLSRQIVNQIRAEQAQQTASDAESTGTLHVSGESETTTQEGSADVENVPNA